MSSTPFRLNIVGRRDVPSITQVNVRSGPNTNYAALFQIPVGTNGLTVLEVRADDQNANLNGKVYQWLRATFPDGRDGWVRDDLVDVIGDGTRFGYPVLAQARPAFPITRTVAPVGVATPQPAAPAPAVPVPPAPTPAVPATPSVPAAPVPAPIPGALDRVRRAAFNITSAFEGGGYASYQTFDSGIVSYGRFQFTLAAGSFQTVISRYLERASGPTADGLRGFLPRIQSKDEELRKDDTLKSLCKAAAAEPVMQQVQDEVATEVYWGATIELSVAPRGLQTALAYALIFDMAINHGRFNHLLPKAEQELGVPNKSKVGENGVTEQRFITKLAQVRRDNLHALAAKLNLPGLKFRGDFWVDLVNSGDWNLQGDSNGNVNVRGKIVQVRNP
jgi:hypothetical protein